MAAVAALTCCANSHPFQERRIMLTEPVKVGRSVAQLRPGQSNVIFDCKVLSRNHALLWYENGKFYLQDTKSSNGTFVNSQRLSKGSEESDPFEVFSGDTVQFGVDVMENSKKVTHSCIIASLQLFHADGREALNTNSESVNSSVGPAIRSQELYQLAQFLQEALHREQMLENKLATLQNIVSSTQTASEGGWQALIDEDRLLSRLGLLENQLSVYAKGQTDNTLKQELVALQADKFTYENTAKDSLRRVFEEKLEAVRKVTELERALSNSEDECSHIQLLHETAQAELQRLVELNEDQTHDLRTLNEKLQEMEKSSAEEKEEISKERDALQLQIEQLLKHEELLQAKIESLQADNDFTNEQLNNIKAKLEISKKVSVDSMRIPESISRAVQVDLVNLLDLNLLQTNEDDEDDGVEMDKSALTGGDHLQEQPESLITMQYQGLTNASLESPSEQLQQCVARLEDSRKQISSLQDELASERSRAGSLTSEMKVLQEELQRVVEEASILKSRATHVHNLDQLDSREPVSLRLLAEDDKQEGEVDERQRMNLEDSFSSKANNEGHIDSMQQEMQRESAKNRAEFAALKDECSNLRQRILDIENEMKKSHSENVELKAEYSRLQESYRELEQSRDRLTNTQATCQLNCTDAQKEADQTKQELTSAQRELLTLREKCSRQQSSINALKAELCSTLEEYSTLSYQTRTLSTCAMAPLILLVLAILIAFYPVLSAFTVTSLPQEPAA